MPAANMRSSKDLQGAQEERKEHRANLGAQVINGGNRAGGQRLPPNGRSANPNLAAFANVPQY